MKSLIHFRFVLASVALVLGAGLSLAARTGLQGGSPTAQIEKGDDREQHLLDETSKKELTSYLVAHYQTPEDYVVSKFKNHDIVYLAEIHYLKPDLLFLQRLIPLLYKAGVRDLGYKRAMICDQGEIDRLITAPTYDNNKALLLSFHKDPQNGTAYQEYADVFRAAWQVNHTLPKGAPRFRILGMDYCPDWSVVKAGDPVVSLLSRDRAWAGSSEVVLNVMMADVIMREIVAKKRKALVYGGGANAWMVPLLDKHETSGMSFGPMYLIHRKIGDRLTTISIRAYETKIPEIDSLLDELPQRDRAIGFDLKGSPLGAFPLPKAVADTMVTDKKELTYSDQIDGVVHLNVLPDPVTLAPGFLTEKLVKDAKRDGWLPDVPSVNLEWINQNIEKIQTALLSQRDKILHSKVSESH